MVTHIVNTLDVVENAGKKVGIISPYRQQVNELRENISDGEYVNVTIDTVDGFQGNQRDVIIFCLTRTHGSYYFTADKRRLNVALSRAERKVFIIGNIEYAQQDALLAKALQFCKITSDKWHSVEVHRTSSR